MKKVTKILIIIMLVAVIALSAVACVQKDSNGLIILKTPKVSIVNNIVKWDKVKNVSEYGVIINDDMDNIVKTKSNTYMIAESKDATYFEIKVIAYGDGKTYSDSQISNTVSYNTPNTLGTPQVTMNVNEDKSISLNWDAIENAVEYRVHFYSSAAETQNLIATENKYTISADLLKKPAVYQFKVSAISDKNDIKNSGMSKTLTHYVTVTLAAPKNPVYTNSSIKWDSKDTSNEEENAEKYVIMLRNIADHSDIYTRESSGTTTAMSNFTALIKENQTYEVLIKATNASQKELYKDSEFVNVMLEGDKTVKATVIKYGAPSNVEFDAETETLSWDKVQGAENYGIEFVSGAKKYSLTTVKADAESDRVSYKVSGYSFITNKDNAGMVFKMSVFVAKNSNNTVVEGDKKDTGYSYQKITTPEKKNGWYEIDELGKLAYISIEPDAKYKLTANIDGLNGEIYPFASIFNGEFDGQNNTVRNLTLISKSSDNGLSLFGEISENAKIARCGFVNLNIADANKGDNAIIANVNKGTISDMVVTATVKSVARVAGIAIENYGTISNVNLDVQLEGYASAGGIVCYNAATAKIINAGVFNSTIKAIGKDETAIAGGIVAHNLGEVSYSYVIKKSEIKTEAFGNKVLEINSLAGGLIGRNEGGKISNSYVNDLKIIAVHSGNKAKSYAGGLVASGSNINIENSYALKINLEGAVANGGIIAIADGNVSIKSTYASTLTFNTTQNKGAFIGIISDVSKLSVNKTYYGNYTINGTSVNFKALGSGDFNGIEAVSRSSMKDIDLGSEFIANKNIDGYTEFKVLKNMLYINNDFDNGTASVGSAEREFSNVYFGGSETKIAKPTIEAYRATASVSYDYYVLETDSQIRLTISRIITSKK